MTDDEVMAEALRLYPWCFPPESDKEDAQRRLDGRKPRCGGDWEPARAWALQFAADSLRRATGRA